MVAQLQPIPLDDLIDQITYIHRARQHYIRQNAELTVRSKAMLRGLVTHGDKQAATMLYDDVVAWLDGKEAHGTDALLSASLLIEPMLQMQETIAAPLVKYTRDLESLSRQLPVYPWVQTVRGFGTAGLGQITAECGNLSNYAGPARVWKRMGLAVIDGGRQRKVAGDAALEHGYSPIRRSIMWVIGDSLLKGNRDGAYRTYYLEEKERQTDLHPDLTPMQRHLRAKRHMEKRLLRDLWRAWRDA